MTQPLYDWPLGIYPAAAIVIAPSFTIDGSLSRNGYENNLAIAGARNQMRLEFNYMKPEFAHWFPWLINNARSARFLVPVFNSPQLAKTASMTAAEQEFVKGIPFSTGQTFSTGYGFLFNPTLDVVAAALEGDNQIVMDEARWPNALTHGKVFGVGRNIYHVNLIERTGTQITVTFTPPLVRDVAAGELATLRPKMVCKPPSIDSFINLFEFFHTGQPGSLTLNEVVDEAYL